MGILILLAYMFSGLVCAHVVLHDKSPLLRVWLGLSFGMLLFMWLPALAAFFVGFTLLGEWIAVGAMLLITGGAVLHRSKHPLATKGLEKDDKNMLIALACLALPLTILSAYLQHTHTLREVDGALHVGQSTYGDLSMHLSIVTGMRGQKLPTEYLFYPGAPMGYPMLMDTTGTTLMIFGMSARWAMIIPGTIMSGIVFGGYMLLAREMTGKTSAGVLAAILLFFNGGLGFFYHFDMAAQDTSRIHDIFNGYYKTPANDPTYNMRWSNLVVDLLLPQRTFLAGWVMLLPALYFVREAFQKLQRRMFLLAALFAAALPLVNTHSFLCLAIYSGCALAYTLITNKKQRRTILKGSGMYLGIVVLLALPQMLAFTMRQISSEGFIQFHFNWMNNENGKLIDFYPWFWLKNVGLPLIVMLCALLDFKKRNRMDMIGAFAIFVIAELILFQPNIYDNNKLLYVWYLLALPSAANWCVSLWNGLAGKRSRVLLAGLFIVCSTLSGALSMAREVKSDHQLFSASDVKAAAFIEENTDPDAMFISGLQHNNPVYALAGRRIVCGPSLFLRFHGMDYVGRQEQVKAFYRDPAANMDLIDEFGVDYITVGWNERLDLDADEDALDELFDVVYDHDGFRIYALKTTEA